MITAENCALWIVNYKREQELADTIASWLKSFPFKDINVICNSDSYKTQYEFEGARISVWPNIFRDEWETGSLAWCWNMAMRHTFLTKDFCILSQDDVVVIPGWDKMITDKYFTYVAPHGDVIQLQSVQGFNRVGWFDERFRAIGGAEADYLLRMLREYPYELSAHDEHIWQLRHNDIGLAEYWINPHKSAAAMKTRVEHNEKFAQKECFDRWVQKWGIPVDSLFLSAVKNNSYYNWKKNWKEIDWYPSFTQAMIEEGRKTNAGYSDCL